MWLILAFIFSNLFSLLLSFVGGFLKGYSECVKTAQKFEYKLQKAKELLKRFVELENCTLDYDDIKEAEQFLSEVENV